MDHDYDYNDSIIPDTTTSKFGLFFTENSSTSLDPYLYLVIPVTAVSPRLTFATSLPVKPCIN